MGASQSQEQPAPEDALFQPDELTSLRKCYAVLASPSTGALEEGAFARLRKGIAWPALYRQMSVVGTPVRWQGFLSTVAKCCKARRSERLAAITALYTGDETAPLTEAALLPLLNDALAAVSGGESEASLTSASTPQLHAIVADVLKGSAGGVVTIEQWIGWVTAQLPQLPLVTETFLLQYLCAVGRASSAGDATPTRAEVPPAALNACQEPLLRPADGQAEGAELLQATSAWLLSLAIPRSSGGEAAEWRCVYASRVMGLSMNRFSHHADGYAGPTLLVVLCEGGEVFGAYVDTALKASDKFFGGPGCLLFTLAPSFHVYTPSGISKNFALYNPPQTGQLASTAYLNKSDAAAAPEVLAFGGQTARLRMSLEDDMNSLRWHTSDTTYGAHPVDGAAPADGVRKVRALELWGCGGADADRVAAELRSRRVRDANRAGKVDRGAMFGMGKGGDWRSEENPDRMILETAGAHTFYSAQLEKLPEEKKK